MERRALVRSIAALGAVAGLGAVGALGVSRFRAQGDRAGADAAGASAASQPLIQVHKSPTCGCCGEWVEHVRANGFRVDVFENEDLGPIKERLGVPYGKGSCHTGEVEGYLVEGHVPAGDIKRLLAERPQARGLVLPGMPIGSPGMEIEGVPAEEFTVELVKLDGETEPFSKHSPPASPSV